MSIPAFTLSKQYTLAEINDRCKNTLNEHLGMEFIELGENFLKARMPVDHRTCQPLGLLNGGASLALAESTGSMAANLCLDREKYVALGLDINGNHLKSVKGGYVYAIATPFHLGKSTHVWQIRIEDEEGNLACICRLTMAVVEVQKLKNS
ncbi:MAG: hotdog fold thioesterase [Bacteroidota bacterium]|nr:hotdog fold thioesterase [Bacteroidota bacterium]